MRVEGRRGNGEKETHVAVSGKSLSSDCLPLLLPVCRVGRTARAGRSGWSLSFVTQYDVQLIQAIEELIGHKLGERKLDEQEVLKGITKVQAACRGLSGVAV